MDHHNQELSVRHDERNLARLNLVLAPNRTKLFEWTKDIQIDALGMIRVSCTAPRNSLVPHGVDNDILLGIVSAAVIQGLPEDDTVRLSIRELLRLSGIKASARAYRNIKASLHRLQHSAYEMIDSWYDGTHHHWRTVSFSLIVKHWSETNDVDAESIGQWKAQTLLAIKLDDSLMNNIRAGHIRPLDLKLLSQLTQPLARTLFRTLAFQREADQSKMVYLVPLDIWATHLGLYNMREDSILRALEPAHKELKACGFLKKIYCQPAGKNKKRLIEYTFAEAEVLFADPKAVNLLTDKKITGNQALLLAQKHSLETIEQTIRAFENLLKTEYRSKVRNTTGLLISMLEKPDDYTNILSSHAVSMRSGSSAPTPKQKKSNTVPSGNEAAPVQRVPSMARTVLLDQFDGTPTRRTLRDRVIQLYVDGRVELLELTQLVNTTDEDATRLVGEWQERSESKAV